jgi:hypothetical protein
VRPTALLLTACLLLAPSLAGAQSASSSAAAASTSSDSEVIATAAGTPASPAQPNTSPLTRWLKDAPPLSLGDDYANGALEQPGPDRGVHGEVGFGVGSNGYRDIYGAATMPVGKIGQLGVAVEDTQFGKPYHYEQRSLSVALALGGANDGPPADCASALRVGDHYVEPLWATRMRGSSLQDADPRCVSADDPIRRN